MDKKRVRNLLAVLFLTFGTSLWFIPESHAEQTGQITVTCANAGGESREFRVGWDNTTQFFQGKGNIAALFCSIATQNQWQTFVSTTAPESTWYYNGVAPTPAPSPSPTPTPTETSAPPNVPATEPSPTPTPVASPSVEPTPEPSPQPTPTQTQTPSTTEEQ